MKTIVFTIALILLGFSQSLLAQQATRIAYVDMNYILANMDEYKVASEQLAQKVAQWEKEIAQKQNEIETRQKKLEAEKPLLTPETIKDKEEEIQVLTQSLEEYKQKRFGAETGDYITQRWRLVQPIQDQVFNITQEIAKTRKFDYILTSEDAAAIYAAEKNDITKVVLRLLKRKDNAEDRNKEISTLLKESLDVDFKTEKQQKKAKTQAQKEKEVKPEQRKVRNERTR